MLRQIPNNQSSGNFGRAINGVRLGASFSLPEKMALNLKPGFLSVRAYNRIK